MRAFSSHILHACYNASMRKALALCAVAVALLVVGCKKAEDDTSKPATTTTGTTAAATQPGDDTTKTASAAPVDGEAKDPSDSANIRASEDGESVQRRASARRSLGMK